MKSLLEIRTEGVVMQEWDSSCGAAALVTVLKYHLNDPVTERVAALSMLRMGDPEQIKKQGGFSLLDLKRYVETGGYVASAYKDTTLEELADMPFAIVPIIEYGRIPHFVVVRSVSGDVLDIADPAFGNRKLSASAFEKIWPSKVAFQVEPRAEAKTVTRGR